MARIGIVAVALVGTLLGLLLSPHAPLGGMLFGAPPAGGAEPTGAQLGALMLVAAVEAVAFGLGLAFLAYGLGAMERRLGSSGATRAAHLAIVWGLVSWVPHSAMHQTNGDDFARLVVIEYAFHVTLVLAAGVLAWALVRAPRARGVGAAPA